MNRSFLLAITAVSTLALSSACVIKESSTSTSGTGGTTNANSSSSSGEGGAGAQGGGAGVGGAGQGGAGQGGGGACKTCGDFLFTDATQDELCASSLVKASALAVCTCGDGMNTNGVCPTECENSCTGGAGEDPDCQTCVETKCTAEWNDCTSDLGE